jgi:hypothetical protein
MTPAVAVREERGVIPPTVPRVIVPEVPPVKLRATDPLIVLEKVMSP